MGHRIDLVFQQPQGEKPLFAIGLMVVLGRQGNATEDLLRVCEIDAMLG